MAVNTNVSYLRFPSTPPSFPLFVGICSFSPCQAKLNANDYAVAALLSKLDFNSKHDHLILAGDTICKGPLSTAVLGLARSLHASCVRGNHEASLLAAHNASTPFDAAKPSSAASLSSALAQEDVAWIASWPAILQLGQIPGLEYRNVVVVHAGLTPGVELAGQDAEMVMRMRSMDAVTKQAFEERGRGRPWSEVWDAAQRTLPDRERVLVVYGHDSKTGLNVKEYSVGLDSGCVKGGELTALVIAGGKRKTSMKIVSVKSRRDYTRK